MQLRSVLVITTCLFINLVCSQNYNTYEFGKVPKEIRELNTYPKDSTAGAVVVFEKGNASIEIVHGVPKLIYDYKVRIKILKNSGLGYANVEIPLYIGEDGKKREKFVEARAISVEKGTGKLLALQKENIFTENKSENYDVVRFTVPNAKVGSVIDYYYKTISPFLFNFQTWKFQWDIPKIHSEFCSSIPANYKYHVKLVGFQVLTHESSDIKRHCFEYQGAGISDCSLVTYVMKNIPAFIEEDFMTTDKNFRSQILFELYEFESFSGTLNKYSKSWKDVDKELKSDEELGKQSKKKSYFKSELPKNLFEGQDPLAKAKEIYSYLQDKMHWNGEYKIFRNIDVKKAYEAGAGSIAELNLILLNTLKSAELDADFMVLSTRKNGFPTKLYPIITEFNYVIVKLDIGTKSYLLDISDKLLDFGILPYRCLNGYGRVMDFNNGSYWFDIEEDRKSLSNTYVKLSMDQTGSIEGTIMDTNSGYFALDKRKYLKGVDMDSYLDKLEDSFENSIITNHTIENLEAREKNVREKIEIQLDNEDGSDELFFHPFILRKFRKNPFKLDERTYPVDFGYKRNFIYRLSLEVPENFAIASVPKSRILRLENDGGELAFKVQKKEKSVYIDFKLSIKRASYFAGEYDALKILFKEAVQIQNNELIVLKRI